MHDALPCTELQGQPHECCEPSRRQAKVEMPGSARPGSARIGVSSSWGREDTSTHHAAHACVGRGHLIASPPVFHRVQNLPHSFCPTPIRRVACSLAHPSTSSSQPMLASHLRPSRNFESRTSLLWLDRDTVPDSLKARKARELIHILIAATGKIDDHDLIRRQRGLLD